MEQALEDWKTFLRFPSIATDPAYDRPTRECAGWLKQYLAASGFETALWETSTHPVVFAQTPPVPNAPTLLFYGHYDVQPVDPLELWDSPPFEPTLRGDNLYARGAQDNKGQIFYTLVALRQFMQAGPPPFQIKVLIEGEEESGSASLSQLLPSKTREVAADWVVVVDVGIPAATVPAITLGLRGIVALEIEAIGTHTDLHSGMHGGVAYNPNHALVELLAKMRTPDGRIAIPGFYDAVRLPEQISNLYAHFDLAEWEAMYGAPPTGGERVLSPYLRIAFRPTLEINGLVGGYTGPGNKTVIPSFALAKLSCRLVPDQTPEAIAQVIAQFVSSHTPPGIRFQTRILPGSGRAVRAHADSPGVQAFASSYTTVFNSPCRFIIEGASIPIVPALAAAAGGEPILIGLGLASDNIHAPNEHFSLTRFRQGVALITQALRTIHKP